ncbi:MAG: hypothetical protein K1X38_04585 [Microthrixaceae bacterium]|nr:hypothetical protein [Microthrixaceae bacterium]
MLFVPRRPSAAAVVWGHGGWVTKEPWADEARELSRTGAYVLALDFQGAGESEGVTSFQGRIDDYVAAMDFLQAALGVTRHTARSQLKAIFAKTGARSRPALLARIHGR